MYVAYNNVHRYGLSTDVMNYHHFGRQYAYAFRLITAFSEK